MAKKKENEPFMKRENRPDIEADTPLSDLTVRDLVEILGVGGAPPDIDVKGINDAKWQADKPLIKDLIKDRQKEYMYEKGPRLEHIRAKRQFEMPEFIPEEVFEGLDRVVEEVAKLNKRLDNIEKKIK